MPTITSTIVRVSKAILTNIFAELAPRAYIRYTHETGRGLQEEGSEDITGYFFQCYEDYLRYLELTDAAAKDYLNNKVLLEYGPGDLPGMALIFYAKGANKVYCVDRFPLLSFSAFNSEALQAIIDKLSPDEQHRAKNSFNQFGNPGSGLKPECIEYITHKKGLSKLDQEIDLIYSRAVLEHVNSLPETLSRHVSSIKAFRHLNTQSRPEKPRTTPGKSTGLSDLARLSLEDHVLQQRGTQPLPDRRI